MVPTPERLVCVPGTYPVNRISRRAEALWPTQMAVVDSESTAYMKLEHVFEHSEAGLVDTRRLANSRASFFTAYSFVLLYLGTSMFAVCKIVFQRSGEENEVTREPAILLDPTRLEGSEPMSPLNTVFGTLSAIIEFYKNTTNKYNLHPAHQQPLLSLTGSSATYRFSRLRRQQANASNMFRVGNPWGFGGPAAFGASPAVDDDRLYSSMFGRPTQPRGGYPEELLYSGYYNPAYGR